MLSQFVLIRQMLMISDGCEFMQQSTPVPKQPSSHPTPFRTFDRRTDDVAKTRHAIASTTANCGSVPKVFEVMCIIDRRL